MIKKLRSLHFNHLKNTFCCFACCFLLLFVSLPVNAADHHGGGRERSSVSDEESTMYTVASFLFGMGITVLDPVTYLSAYSSFMSHFDALSDDENKASLKQLFDDNKNGYSTVYNLSYDCWHYASDVIFDWVRSFDDGETVFLSVTPNDSGKIGFTSDSLFSISFPNDAVMNDIYHVDLGKSYLDFGRVQRPILSSMYPAMGIPSTDADYPYYYSRIFNSSGFGQVIAYASSSRTLWSAGSFNSSLSNCSDSTSPSNYAVKFSSSGIVLFIDYHLYGTYPNRRVLWYDSDGNTYNLTTYTTESGGSRYAFISTSDQSHYMDMDFPNYHRAICWFADSCGLEMPNSSYSAPPYSPHSSDSPFNSYDPDDVSDTISLIENFIQASDDHSLPMILIGNDSDLATMNNNPSFIFNPDDFDLIPLYPSEIPKINTNLDMWKRKFPFCIPFDFYTMLTSFSAEQEIPQFTFVAIPANSFGLGNDDLYLSIDFEPFDPIVQMLRFFLGLGFCVFLILSTKNFIK